MAGDADGDVRVMRETGDGSTDGDSQPATPTTSGRPVGSFTSEEIIALELQSRQLARNQSSEQRHSGSPVDSRSSSFKELKEGPLDLGETLRSRRHSSGASSGGSSPRKRIEVPPGTVPAVPAVVVNKLASPTPDALREKLHMRRRCGLNDSSSARDPSRPFRVGRAPVWRHSGASPPQRDLEPPCAAPRSGRERK